MTKKFNETQRRWPTHEREAFAVVYALHHWADYCTGRTVDVITDHANLRWLLDAKKGKLANWAVMLSLYDLRIFHRAGADIAHVDYSSRYTEAEELIPNTATFDSVWAAARREEGVAILVVVVFPIEGKGISAGAAKGKKKVAQRRVKSVRAGAGTAFDGKTASTELEVEELFPPPTGLVTRLSKDAFGRQAFREWSDAEFTANALTILPSLRAEVECLLFCWRIQEVVRVGTRGRRSSAHGGAHYRWPKALGATAINAGHVISYGIERNLVP